MKMHLLYMYLNLESSMVAKVVQQKTPYIKRYTFNTEILMSDQLNVDVLQLKIYCRQMICLCKIWIATCSAQLTNTSITGCSNGLAERYQGPCCKQKEGGISCWVWLYKLSLMCNLFQLQNIGIQQTPTICQHILFIIRTLRFRHKGKATLEHTNTPSTQPSPTLPHA